MNEQIKQLWVDAAKTTQGDSWEEQTKFMERFAKLIVRECAGIIESQDVDPAFKLRMSWAVKEHFGVE